MSTSSYPAFYCKATRGESDVCLTGLDSQHWTPKTSSQQHVAQTIQRLLPSFWKTFPPSKMNSFIGISGCSSESWFPVDQRSPLFLFIGTVFILHSEWESPAGIDPIYLFWWRGLWVFPLWVNFHLGWDSSLWVALGPVMLGRSGF